MAKNLVRQRRTLSLRQHKVGGPLAGQVKFDAKRINSRKLLVLVHGFNNTHKEANRAYSSFRKSLTNLSDCRPNMKKLEYRLSDLYWPGDADWGMAKPAVYPLRVTTAKNAGPKLASFLANRQNLSEIEFIGHSLGCRVVLETIDQLRTQRAGLRVSKVCLMAAAVPAFMLQERQRLHRAIRHCGSVMNLHSRDDWVLKLAFRGGQTAATGNEGLFPKALGAAAASIPQLANLKQQVIPGAGHGDYWGNNGKQAVAKINEYMQLNGTPLKRQVGHARSTPVPRRSASRQMLAARVI